MKNQGHCRRGESARLVDNCWCGVGRTPAGRLFVLQKQSLLRLFVLQKLIVGGLVGWRLGDGDLAGWLREAVDLAGTGC